MKSSGFNGVDRLSVAKLVILLEWAFVTFPPQGERGAGAGYLEE